jgi:hypothetical protein
MLSGSDTWHIVVKVSQMDFADVEHPNGTLHTAMRIGKSVLMRIQQ